MTWGHNCLIWMQRAPSPTAVCSIPAANCRKAMPLRGGFHFSSWEPLRASSAVQWDRGQEEEDVRDGITAFPLPEFLLFSDPTLSSMERHIPVEWLEKRLSEIDRVGECGPL